MSYIENFIITYESGINFTDTFFEIVICQMAFSTFFTHRYAKSRQWPLLLAVCVLHAILQFGVKINKDSIFATNFFAAIAFHCVMLMISGKILYRCKIRLVFLLAYILIVLMLIADCLTGITVASVFNGVTSFDQITDFTVYRVIGNFASLLLRGVIVFLVYKYRENIKLDYLPRNIFLYIIVLCALFLVVSSHIAFYLTVEESFPEIRKYLLLWICLTVMFFLSLFLLNKMNAYYRRNQESAVISIKNEMLEENIRNMQTANERNSVLIHDTRHHIGIIDSLVQSGDYSELEKYVTRLNQEQKAIPPRFQCEDKFIEAIINAELAKATDLGINMFCTIDYPPDTVISPTDINTILSNLIDNALEACVSAPQGERMVDVIIRPVYNHLSIKVQNTVRENPLITNPGLKSTKKSNHFHGLGIKSVKQVIAKYDGEISFSFDDGFFCCVITLCSIISDLPH